MTSPSAARTKLRCDLLNTFEHGEKHTIRYVSDNINRELNDGKLASELSKLEDEGFIDSEKEATGQGKRYRILPKGIFYRREKSV